MEKENFQMHGQAAQDSFIHGLGEPLTRKQTTSRPDNVWPEITHCGLLPKEDDLLFALLCYLPTCHLFRDSRPLGLTLRLSTPVCCCHRVSWTRGRLALAQEAVRVFPFSHFSIFLFLLIFARPFRLPSSKFSSSGVEM